MNLTPRSAILLPVVLVALGFFLPNRGLPQEASITVRAGQVLHRVSPYLTGACIEDVNHEVYGGIDSQMLFGESFAEPEPQPPLTGFTVFSGRWLPEPDGSIRVTGGDGPKLVAHGPSFSAGEASVDIWFGDRGPGNAGFILKVSDPGKGRDDFNGYEVALEPAGTLVLGRHRQNWEPIRRVPCEVPVNQWVTLAVRLGTNSLEVRVNGQTVTRYEDTEHPLASGVVGLRAWQREVRFRNLSIAADGEKRPLAFVIDPSQAWGQGVSGMWRPLRTGTANVEFSVVEQQPFSGSQSQRVRFLSGAGEVGIENRGLNRWGLHLRKGKLYEGYIWARAEKPLRLLAALESPDGSTTHATRFLNLRSREWQRLDFKLTPKATADSARFALKLAAPGSVDLGYAFLQPGAWGRFKGLPVRKDVADGLIGQGITVLRQGGCMVNAAEYRWKNMIGPRAHRPPYRGWWYPHSSNGWGIFEFLNFCEAARVLGVPDVNMGETPQDMADFIEYANGQPNSTWGRKRAADGHPKPYRLKYLQLGNEERVDEAYWQKFKPIAEAVWARDPDIILVVGDFAYGQPISDPFNFTGAAAGITSLAAHRNILQLAKRHDREVWFDIHIGTEGPRPDFGGSLSYIDALAKIADGAKHRVVIFEFNAGNHSQRRALANAAAINAVERDGRLPIATSANCLQPDGQNDNGWNQGLLFLNQSRVWLQPPGYVTQMISRQYQPLLVQSEVRGTDDLDVTAKISEDRKTLVLQVVNFSEHPRATALRLEAFEPRRPAAAVRTLAAPLEARTTADRSETVKPTLCHWRHELRAGATTITFPPHSFTTLEFN